MLEGLSEEDDDGGNSDQNEMYEPEHLEAENPKPEHSHIEIPVGSQLTPIENLVGIKQVTDHGQEAQPNDRGYRVHNVQKFTSQLLVLASVIVNVL